MTNKQITVNSVMETVLKFFSLSIAAAILFGLLASCTSSKTVYRLGKGWKSMSAKSEITGWNRSK